MILRSFSPFMVLYILTSQQGVSFYGQYALKYSLLMILVTIGDLGLSMEIPKLISRNKKNLQLVSSYMTIYFVLKLSIALILSIIFIFLIDADSTLKLVMVLCLICRSLDPSVVFQGLQIFGYVTKVTVITIVLHVFLLLMTDLTIDGMEKVFSIYLIVLLTSNLLYYYNLFNSVNLRVKKFSLANLINTMKPALEFYFARFFPTLYIQGSTYGISFIIPIDLVAIYAIALDFYKIALSLIGSVGLVLFTTLSATKNFELLKRTTVACLFVQMMLTPLFFAFGGHLLGLVFDFDIELLFNLSFFFYVALVFPIINSFWGYPAFSAINQDRLAHICLFASAAVYYFVFFMLVMNGSLTIITAVFCIILADFVQALLKVVFSINKGLLP